MSVWLLGLALGGEIVGSVVDAQGDPIEGVLVLAYDNRLEYELDSSEADGSFRIRDLPSASVRVRLIPPEEVNAVEYYWDAEPNLCDALLVDVSAEGAVDLGQIEMPQGAVIRGTVLGPDGQPLEGAEVTARPHEQTPVALPREAVTDADGRFEIVGLNVESDGAEWNVEVEGEGIADQYLGPGYSTYTAAVFSVEVGVPVETGEWQILPGVTLRGTVRGPEGPVASGTVNANTTGLTREAEIVDGAYEITGLAPGEAVIWVDSPGLASTWLGDQPRPADTLTVTDGDVIEGVDFELPPEGRLVGVLTGVEDFGDSRVSLYDVERTISTRADVLPDGRFELGQLPEGAWTLELDPDDDLDVVDGPLLTIDGNLLEVSVRPGEVVDLGSLAVPRGGIVRGTAFDRADGSKVYGAWVTVENVNTGTTRLVQSERGGKFKATGLPAGVYRIRAEYTPYCEPDPDWVTRHYPDQRNGVLGGTVPLAPGQVVRWNPRLARDQDHDEMGDGWEADYGLEPTVDDALEDFDGDGFSNLEEYLLGTDPAGGGEASCGCAQGGAAWLIGALPIGWWRRRESRTPSQSV